MKAAAAVSLLVFLFVLAVFAVFATWHLRWLFAATREWVTAPASAPGAGTATERIGCPIPHEFSQRAVHGAQLTQSEGAPDGAREGATS